MTALNVGRSVGGSVDPAVKALRELRLARRAHRLQNIHWSDSLYRLYVVIVGGGFLLGWVVTLLENPKLAPSTRLQIIERGPAEAGLLIALALGAALRSGSRGGPLSLEAADVAHVMQAPIPRSVSLVRPYIHQLRRGVYVGGLSGLCLGAVSQPFLLGSTIGWIAAGTGLGALVGVAFIGVAATASGNSVTRRVASGALFVLLVWSAIDVLATTVTSPMTLMGSGFFLCMPGNAAMRPAPEVGLAIVAFVAVVAGVLGRRALGGTSLEQAERRTALVGELRFAVSTQDLRAALLLRRQLAAERPRATPWFSVKGKPGVESAVRVRALRGLARWPVSRVVRVVLLALIAGVSARIAWEHTIPLVLVPGVLLYLVGLDACEAMAQDVDHPDITALMPRHRGRLANRQTVVPFFVLAAVGALSGLAAFATGLAIASDAPADFATLGVCIAVGLVGSVTATAGAALSLVIGPPPFTMMIQTPELAVGYTLLSPIVSLIGSAGAILWSRSSFRAEGVLSAVPGLFKAAVLSATVVYFCMIGITSKGLGATKR